MKVYNESVCFVGEITEFFIEPYDEKFYIRGLTPYGESFRLNEKNSYTVQSKILKDIAKAIERKTYFYQIPDFICIKCSKTYYIKDFNMFSKDVQNLMKTYSICESCNKEIKNEKI